MIRSCTASLKSAFVEQNIKERLQQKTYSHVIYEGDDFDNLQGSKMYEVRRRLTKMELIQKVIKETIIILKEKEMIKGAKATMTSV